MPKNAFEKPIEPGPIYEAPAITSLGTLTELTLGGTDGQFDMEGAAGDEGSL